MQHNNRLLNNSWVVPYNPYLLLRYNCHINVEICASTKATKYLYKYIHKGGDKIITVVIPRLHTQNQRLTGSGERCL